MKVLLVVYDNDAYIHWFPQGLAYIAAVLRKAGHQITVYSQDYHHYPESHLTAYLDNHERFDVIGIGVIAGYYQYKKLIKISRAIAEAKNRPARYIIGGHGAAPEPEYFIKKTGADVIVIGEGEETVVELLDALAAKKPLTDILGIAFKDGETVKINPRRPLIKDIDSIPWPAYDLFPVDYYKLMRSPRCAARDFIMPVLSGRGCHFHCNFCYRMDEGFRPRSAEAIIEEVKFLQKNYGITYVVFSDELLMSSPARITELCEAFIRARLNIKWWCNGRLNYATAEALALMKKAGCVFINYGIESFDDGMLKTMNKSLTTAQIEKGIKATLAAGISPGFNIIFGNIGETKEILMKGVEFLLKYDDGAECRTIRPVTPYPGSPLYYYAIEKGLLQGAEDFYEHKHQNSDLLTVNFTSLSDEEFYNALMEANNILLNRYYERQKQSALDLTSRLYKNKDSSFRGFRHT